jgi:hypothetical protein
MELYTVSDLDEQITLGVFSSPEKAVNAMLEYASANFELQTWDSIEGEDKFTKDALIAKLRKDCLVYATVISGLENIEFHLSRCKLDELW